LCFCTSPASKLSTCGGACGTGEEESEAVGRKRRVVGVMVDDTLDELLSDEWLEECGDEAELELGSSSPELELELELHRVFFSFRDFD
jgi:hypothetical protein